MLNTVIGLDYKLYLSVKLQIQRHLLQSDYVLIKLLIEYLFSWLTKS